MLTIEHIGQLRDQVNQWKKAGERIAFVPTMGNLHQGHLSLMQQGSELADRLICSIFVNPMQFAPSEDLDNYPRTFQSDHEALDAIGCDLLFYPQPQLLYPQGLDQITRVTVPGITEALEGEHRPGHFTGVTTIVLKLFNLVQPDIAIFGKKDYQQWRTINKMVADLDLPIDIIGADTVREADGLAMSSRNQYLSDSERPAAAQLHQQLQQIKKQLQNGSGNHQLLCNEAVKQLESQGFKVDYLDIRRQQDLQKPGEADDLVVLTAARLGTTRLIDNLEIKH